MKSLNLYNVTSMYLHIHMLFFFLEDSSLTIADDSLPLPLPITWTDYDIIYCYYCDWLLGLDSIELLFQLKFSEGECVA